MGFLFLLGRVLYGGYFIKSGIAHFTKSDAMTGYAGSKSVPKPRLAVYVSGLLLLIGGFGIFFGVYVSAAAAAIVLFLVPVSFMMHAYWRDTDPVVKMANTTNFWKNMALLGAALMLVAL